MPHAVARLRAERLARSRKPFLARGARGPRCPGCRVLPEYCLCQQAPRVVAEAAVCLLMYDVEALKPSNTGWLIADVLDDCHAFLWQRTTVDPALLSLLADPRYAPCVVFPAEYAEPQRLISQAPDCSDGRRPLFILLDATWNEARKMFRRSPYLAHLPVLALQPETLSRYRLRRSRQAGHLCTAEVAALCLELAGEPAAAAALDGWFGLFSERYLDAKQRRPLDLHSPAMQQLLETQERFGQSWASSMPASISAQPK